MGVIDYFDTEEKLQILRAVREDKRRIQVIISLLQLHLLINYNH